MALLTSLPRATRTVAPQGPTRINWGEPLTRGLVFAAPLAGQLRAPDLVGGLMPSVTTPIAAVSPIGIGAKIPNSNNNILTYSNNSLIGNAVAYSISVWVCLIAAATAIEGLVTQFNNTAATDHFQLQTTNGVGVRLVSSNTAGGGMPAAGGNVLTAGVPYHLVGTFGFDVIPRVYLNGALVGTGGALSGTPQNASTASVVIGNTQSATTLANAFLNNVAIWNRALSRGEIQRLYANRWALYEPAGPERFILALSAGGTPATVAISPISFSLAPQSVAASGAAAVGVSPISFTLTPQSAAGSGAASVGVTPIAFNLTPQAVAATGAASVAVTPITLNLAPQTAGATGAATAGITPIPFTLTVQSVAASVAVTTLPLHGAALDVATWHSGTADLPTFHANPEETP